MQLHEATTSQLSNKNTYSLHKQKLRVLVIEDEVLFARAVVKRLNVAGYDCEHAENIADAKVLIKQFVPDIALLDMRLPDGNGLDLLPELVSKSVATIVMTAYGELSDAVSAIKQGATEYLKKPVDLDELLLIVDKAETSSKLQSQLDYSRQRNVQVTGGIELIGDSPAMRSIRTQIDRIANLVGNEEAIPPTVLIHGETGTGKDVAARMLHHASPNFDKPFVHVDCASLPGELIESELFGHEKGAFTSAQGSRSGLIEAAEDGTLFLDEIGELPLTLQAKLLNVLERRMVRRVGSTKERPVLARFVAATNRDLQEMVNEGRFRSDLYYRLNVLTMIMPPLRDRADDALLLAQHFAGQTEKRYNLDKRFFSQDAIAAIRAYKWPGNVRELKHQISRAVLLSHDTRVTAEDLALNPSTHMHGSTATMLTASVSNQFSQTLAKPMMEFAPGAQMTLDSAEKMLIENALQQSNRNVSEAARKLGITRMAMRYRMEKHNING